MISPHEKLNRSAKASGRDGSPGSLSSRRTGTSPGLLATYWSITFDCLIHLSLRPLVRFGVLEMRLEVLLIRGGQRRLAGDDQQVLGVARFGLRTRLARE